MRELEGNLWAWYNRGFWIAITTNGSLRKDGYNVMGKGCALHARQLFPDLPRKLGDFIKTYGNRVAYLGNRIFSFPVKTEWYLRADLHLIETSAQELVKALDTYNIPSIIVPRPGCGNGRLSWTQVKRVLINIFDDRFFIISPAVKPRRYLFSLK